MMAAATHAAVLTMCTRRTSALSLACGARSDLQAASWLVFRRHSLCSCALSFACTAQTRQAVSQALALAAAASSSMLRLVHTLCITSASQTLDPCRTSRAGAAAQLMPAVDTGTLQPPRRSHRAPSGCSGGVRGATHRRACLPARASGIRCSGVAWTWLCLLTRIDMCVAVLASGLQSSPRCILGSGMLSFQMLQCKPPAVQGHRAEVPAGTSVLP